MRTKVICLGLLLCICVGVLTACSSGSIAGTYKDDYGYYSLQVKDDNTAAFKTINWTYKGTYTYENDVLRLKYKGLDSVMYFDFTRRGNDFYYEDYPSFPLRRK